MAPGEGEPPNSGLVQSGGFGRPSGFLTPPAAQANVGAGKRHKRRAVRYTIWARYLSIHHCVSTQNDTTHKSRSRAMAARVTDGGMAPGHPGLETVSIAVRAEASVHISKLLFGQLYGNARKIYEHDLCRIDRQPPPSGGSNLQVQLNGVHGDSSIATCVIASSIFETIEDWPSGLRLHQEGWLLRRVRIALTESLRNGHIYRIIGSFQDEDTPANLKPRAVHGYRVGPPADPSKRRWKEHLDKKRLTR